MEGKKKKKGKSWLNCEEYYYPLLYPQEKTHFTQGTVLYLLVLVPEPLLNQVF